MFHFIGIKGAGMSALAVVMKQLGYEVKGSDLEKHFFTEEELVKNNISFTKYSESNIKDGMTIIKGLSITDDNIELITAKKLNLEIIDYNEMVGKLTKKFKTIGISGCHGKTTTTAMMSLVINSTLGANYLIGDGEGYANIDNEFFILECCEYRRHFLSYSPYYAIILNIDLDHVDYFKDIDDLIDAYHSFAIKAEKFVILNGDDKNIRKMKLDKDKLYFGTNEGNDIQAIDIKYTKDGTSFSLLYNKKLYGHFDIPVYGYHQLMDALAVISVCILEKIDVDLVSSNIKMFRGAKRRFTETFVNDCVIVDDYAHHPNEIKAVLSAVNQKYPDKVIVAIFQPHTFTRTKEFAEDIALSLSSATASYILDIHPAREKQEDYPDVTSNLIIDKLNNGYKINIYESPKLSKYENAVFVFMSPNDISKLEQDLISLLKNKQVDK